MTGALHGLRVIDATSFALGPIATQMLGDMGADVIKVEPPEGEPTRNIGRMRSPRMGSFFLNMNRNKRSIVLDLKQAAGQEVLHRLLASADVFVHNMRSKAAIKLGLDYDALAGRYPRLIHATAQGFGARGRYFDQPAYDDVIQGLSGVPGLNARMTGTASYAPMLLADKLCGVYLYGAITTALLHRERTGKGQAVQLPMFEVMTSFNLHEHMADAVFGAPGAADATPPGYARVFSRVRRPLPTRDGSICLIANTDAQWQRLFGLMDRPELASDPRFATIKERMANLDALYDIVGTALLSRTTAEWLALFSAADVPASPANDVADVLQDQHLTDRAFFRTFQHPTEGDLLMPDIPITYTDSPGAIHCGPPRLGEHTREILASLGYNAEEIDNICGVDDKAT
ncbi:MAG TPA: CoA transferase [Burkholderiaceae bacterium]|nr:CoA transferase [Burkholderiaceae bacterium]